MASPKLIHVAVAVIANDRDQVLLTLRADDTHQGGLWEFPGGKLEGGEQTPIALQRECHEELGINVVRSRPFMRILHDYSDCQVLLDVCKVEEYSGAPSGKEGQAMEWVDREKLSQRDMPAANRAIVNALLLPDEYLITPDIATSQAVFLEQLQYSLQAGISLVQLRQTQLPEQDFVILSREVLELARQYDAKVMLNHSLAMYPQCAPDGLHLNSQRLMDLCERPVSMHTLLSASCHNLAEVQQANKMDVDFIVIAPVLATLTHPDASILGWRGFRELADAASMPAYALGGLSPSDKTMAFEQGAQGIAAIRSLWKTEQ